MTSARQVAFLRGINVGGNKLLPMKGLAELCTAAGCGDVQTYIQSGNVVFSAPKPLLAKFPAVLAAAILKKFKFEVPVVVRSAEELAARLEIELPRSAWHQLQVIEMAETPVARLRAHLAAIHETITTTPEQFDEPAVRQALEDALLVEIMDMLPTARPADPGRSAVAHKRTVDRARLPDPAKYWSTCRGVSRHGASP